MPLSDQEIAGFEQALKGSAPAWDPEWKIAKTLLELVRVQADRILTLEEQLQAGAFSQQAAIAGILGAIQGGLQTQITPGRLTNAQVGEATQQLNAAIRQAQSGKQIVEYAGAILKFVAKILV